MDLSTTFGGDSITAHTTTIYINPFDLFRSVRYQWSLDIIAIILPIMLIFGTIGNILSIVVLWKREALNKNTTTIYLICLAVIDEFVLLTGLLKFWCDVAFNLDIRLFHSFGCQFYEFFIYALFMFEPWVLVNLTLEKLVAVYVPHKSKILFTNTKAVIGLIVTLIPVIVYNCHFFLTVKVHHHNAGTPFYFKTCDVSDPKYSYFNNVTFQRITLALGCAIPFTVLFVSNIAIIVKVFLANQRRKEITTSGPQTKMSNMTAILLVISLSYLALNLPMFITMTMLQEYLQEGKFTYKETEFLFLINQWTHLFSFLNYVINFYLYFITSARIRKEFKAMFSIGSKPENILSVATTSFHMSTAE